MGVAVKVLRIGRRGRADQASASSPLELALAPAVTDGRWHVPDRFNFTRDVVEVLARDPKRNAVTFIGSDGVIEPRSFTYFSEGAARWAATLREHEVRPGDRVIVQVGMTPEWLEILLACLKVGAVAVPFGPGLPAETIEARVSLSGASLIVAARSAEAEMTRADISAEVHYVDEGRRRRASDTPPDVPTHDTSAKDPAFVLSTSGAAGGPRGVVHSHGATFTARLQAEHWLDAHPGDAVWCATDAGSPLAVWNVLLGPWSRGAEVLLHEGPFDPAERLDLIDRLGATILCQSPSDYGALAKLPRLGRFRPRTLRRLVSTGEFLGEDVVSVFEEAWGLTIHDGYGQGETNVIVANGVGTGHRPGSIGLPLPGIQASVIDDQGNELSAGIAGDLAVRGRPPALFTEYWAAPEETKAAFRGDWYVTGDVAASDEDGFLWLLGRAADVIESRGRTFGPAQVEQALRHHAAVSESAVVGVRDLATGGHFVRAFVVPETRYEGSEQLEAELRTFVEESLPEQAVPREIVFVEELPTTEDGKIKRAELRERAVVGRPLWDTAPGSEPEQTAIEAAPTFEPEPVAEPVAEADVVETVTEASPETYVEPVAEIPPESYVVEPVAEVPPETYVEPVAEIPPESYVVEPVAEVPPETYVEPVAEIPPESYVVEPVVELPLESYVEPVPETPPEADLVESEPVPEPVPEADVVEPVAEAALEADVAEPQPVVETPPDAYAIESEPITESISDSRVAEPVAASEPGPWAEPQDESGPLPDYIVVRDENEAPASPATHVPELDFPAVTDLGLDSAARDEPRPKPEQSRAPAPAAKQPKRRRSAPEPGEDGDDVSWMRGLSGRLSAYSLGSDADARDEEPDGDDEDAQTGA
jgi:acyl-coenzyme A synthetase/AMP-(fatty) acid ligase